MPCGTEISVSCHNCGQHDLKSMFRCKVCDDWFCAGCVIQPENICVSCTILRERANVSE